MEKTIEELQKELADLKAQNLQREIEAEKAKVEEAKKAEEKATRAELEEKIRLQVLKEMEVPSKVVNEDKPEMVNASSSHLEEFKAKHFKRLGLTGMSYEDLCKEAYYNALR